MQTNHTNRHDTIIVSVMNKNAWQKGKRSESLVRVTWSRRGVRISYLPSVVTLAAARNAMRVADLKDGKSKTYGEAALRIKAALESAATPADLTAALLAL